MPIKVFNQHGDKFIKAKVTIEINMYLRGEHIEEMTPEMAKELAKRELEYLSDSNDGSELLLNAKDIQFFEE